MKFRNESALRRHYLSHRVEVDFLTKQATPGLHECLRSKGDLVRYDATTEEFGIVGSDGFVRTYFKPALAWHGLASNMDYFRRECSNY